MLRRMTRRLVQAIAVTIYSTLEVLGLPKVPPAPAGQQKKEAGR